VIADEVARALVKGGGLAQLLGDPGVGRVPRRAHVADPPRGLLDDAAGEERPEEPVRDREEVAGPDVRGVVAEEGGPRLPARARGAVAAQIGLDRALGHADAELAQFAADALRTPERIVGRHPSDQGDGLRLEWRSARPRARFPPPEGAEPRAMPAQ